MKKDVKTLFAELNTMNEQGKTLEAFEKYYDENVVMQENEEAPRVGKVANRENETASAQNLLTVNKSEILSVAFGDNLVMFEIRTDVSNKDGSRVVGTQVVVQRWKNEKIISEKFYYNAV